METLKQQMQQQQQQQPIGIAKCVIIGNNNAKHGTVTFVEYNTHTSIEFNLYDLPTGKHGCHVHEYGDMSNGCESMGEHFNPKGGVHKDINIHGNHLGDLGNIYVTSDYVCMDVKTAYDLPLFGIYGVIGRGLVIHANKDDLGLGNNAESIKTGNSGTRIACGIIVVAGQL